jgi:hypothetical protein
MFEAPASPLAVEQAGFDYKAECVTLAYALMDGLFQHALLGHLSGDASAAGDLDEHVQQVLRSVLARS